MKTKWFTSRKQLPNLHLDLWLITLGIPLSWLLQQNCIIVRGKFSHVNVTIITIGSFKSRVSSILTSPVPQPMYTCGLSWIRKFCLQWRALYTKLMVTLIQWKFCFHMPPNQRCNITPLLYALYTKMLNTLPRLWKNSSNIFKFMLFFLLLHSYCAYSGSTLDIVWWTQSLSHSS